MIDEKKKAAAVARILSRASTAAKEAFYLKCDVRTIERAVSKARLEAGAARPATPPPGASPPPPPPPPAAAPDNGGKNTVLAKVLDAADGGTSGPPPSNSPPPPPEKKPTPEEETKKRDVDFALGQMRELKETGTGLSALLMRIPLSDERVEEAAELSWFAENSIENNAAQVAEWFRAATKGGPWLLILILVVDVVASAMAMMELNQEYREKRDAARAKKVPVRVVDKPSEQRT